MDISICFADFPTEAIGDTTRDYRQLGIGYANLGALLMAMGLGYDSDGGRAMAATITSLMTGTSYKRSRGAGRDRRPLRRLRPQRRGPQAGDAQAPGRQRHGPHVPHRRRRRSTSCATQAWADVIKLGEANGFRNAQASVLAPTGTIGFMMDCDTTGIEPDFSLVKFKKLVGGGSMQIVNQTIPRALRKLGLRRARQIEAIVDFIAENGHVIDAPGLKTEHYEVFDTAMGARALKPMGHVRMMAAAQPFLSGAISKTVNLPETRHGRGDRGHLPAVAGSSASRRPRSTATTARSASRCPTARREASKKDQAPSDAVEPCRDQGRVEKVVYRPTRKRLPKSRASRTTSFTVGGAEGYMTSGAHDDGELGEVFLKLGKQGSTLAGVMDAFSIAVSIGLQYGVPLETYVSKFTNLRFEPAGLTDDPDVRMAQSIMDYIFRRLALDYLTFETAPGSASTPPTSASATSRPAPTSSPTEVGNAAEVIGDLVRARSVELVETDGRRARRDHGRARGDRQPRSQGRAQGGPHLRRALREDHRHRRRLPALHDLRHQDAPRRLLLRLRRLRQHQRLQLTSRYRRRPGTRGAGPSVCTRRP